MGPRFIGTLALATTLSLSCAARAEEETYYDPDEALAQSLGYSLAVAGVGGLLLLTEPAFGATVLGLGLTITPSLGHFYADNWAQGALTAAGRLIASTAAVVCLVGAAFPEQLDAGGDPDGWSDKRKIFLAAGLAGAATTLGLAAFDIATAKAAARQANERAAQTSSRPRWGAWVSAGGGGLSASVAF
jgi:hypothetical protein